VVAACKKIPPPHIDGYLFLPIVRPIGIALFIEPVAAQKLKQFDLLAGQVDT